MIKHRIVQHLGFWVFAFLVLLRIFSDGDMWSRTNLIYAFLFLLSLFPAVYLNLKYLIPHFWAKYRWIPYSSLIFSLIIGSIIFNEFIFEVLTDWIFPGYFFISYYTYFEIAQFVIIFLVVSTLFKAF